MTDEQLQQAITEILQGGPEENARVKYVVPVGMVDALLALCKEYREPRIQLPSHKEILENKRQLRLNVGEVELLPEAIVDNPGWYIDGFIDGFYYYMQGKALGIEGKEDA